MSCFKNKIYIVKSLIWSPWQYFVYILSCQPYWVSNLLPISACEIHAVYQIELPFPPALKKQNQLEFNQWNKLYRITALCTKLLIAKIIIKKKMTQWDVHYKLCPRMHESYIFKPKAKLIHLYFLQMYFIIYSHFGVNLTTKRTLPKKQTGIYVNI